MSEFSKELQNKLDAQTAPKVTKEQLESLIVRAEYWQVPDTLLIVCSLVLKNGFTVTGESACVDPANFIREVGEKYAYDKAFQKMWVLEGYLLASKLYEHKLRVEKFSPKFERSQMIDPLSTVYTLTSRVQIVAMSRGTYNIYRGWTLPIDEDGSDDGYMIQELDGQQHLSWLPKEVFEAQYEKPVAVINDPFKV